MPHYRFHIREDGKVFEDDERVWVVNQFNQCPSSVLRAAVQIHLPPADQDNRVVGIEHADETGLDLGRGGPGPGDHRQAGGDRSDRRAAKQLPTIEGK